MQTNDDREMLVSFRVDENHKMPVLHQIIRIAIYDEYHAYETYKKVIETFGPVQPFANIMQAEINHFEALSKLAKKYEVPLPVNDWEDKIEAPSSLLEASEVGVAAEIDNIRMYDRLIEYAKEYSDVLDLMQRLQAASYNNHLPAFRQSVAKYSHESVDLKSIYEQFSAHTNAQEEGIKKIEEIGQMVQKFAKGQVGQEEIIKLLSSTNLSFIGGALLGAVGAMIFSQIQKGSKANEKE